ncbi:MAG: 16S rRNA (uracil(1498)-N(3))-methyltransferase [Firmicutes bacterium HGW-Firmicutes-1]|jgi:16S rRNA (uracil1498-N3)-methyltransferase|nr:MAG: 16S rRNA (uracil(1498)-N(3))-methyltransferase [Firmicutes bacterium HGW-Firmicutes-1]
MHRFFVEDNQIEENYITIEGADVNHIVNVLRLSTNEEIIISNRQGQEYCCIIDLLEKEFVKCKIQSVQQSNQELPTKIYLFQGIPKQDKMELIIQKSIELGVYEIVPVVMARSIVKINQQNKEKKNDRWQRIASAAAKQSHRAIIPTVTDAMSFDEALQYAGKLENVIVPYEKASDMKSSKEIFSQAANHGSIGIFIGPEGGFDEIEIERLMAMEASIVSLGKRILRTETAGMVVLSILMYNLEVE